MIELVGPLGSRRCGSDIGVSPIEGAVSREMVAELEAACIGIASATFDIVELSPATFADVRGRERVPGAPR